MSFDEVPLLSRTDSETDGEVEDREKEGEDDPGGERRQPGFPDFLIGQIIAKFHSFRNMYDML